MQVKRRGPTATENRIRRADIDEPTVTVVTPAFNAGPYIARAIESCIHQSLQDWEMLVVDDGSSDDTAAQVQAVADPRVRLIATEGGLGPGGARNVALGEARGTYIAPLDADDAFAPERLAVLVLEAHVSGSHSIVFYRPIRSAADPFSNSSPDRHGRSARPRHRRISLHDFVASSPPCKPLISARLIREAGATYPESLVAAEDYAFIVQLLDAGAELIQLDADLYWHRLRDGSLTRGSAIEIYEAQIRALVSAPCADVPEWERHRCARSTARAHRTPARGLTGG